MLSLFLAGCAGDRAPTGNAALGIAEFQMQETATELDIVGLNPSQAEVASLVLRLGHVSIPEEQLDGDGRTLDVTVKGAQIEHKSVGTQPVTLPLPGDKNLGTFLLDPNVAPVLAKWGVTLNDGQPAASGQNAGERAYDACTHGFSGACGETSCGEYNYGGTYEDVCCGSTKGLVNRSCSSGGTSACGTNGPQGCAVCWSSAYTSFCSIGACSDNLLVAYTDSSYRLDGYCAPDCSHAVNCGDPDGCGGMCYGDCYQATCTWFEDSPCGPVLACF